MLLRGENSWCRTLELVRANLSSAAHRRYGDLDERMSGFEYLLVMFTGGFVGRFCANIQTNGGNGFIPGRVLERSDRAPGRLRR